MLFFKKLFCTHDVKLLLRKYSKRIFSQQSHIMLFATQIMTSLSFNRNELSFDEFSHTFRVHSFLHFLPYFVNKLLLARISDQFLHLFINGKYRLFFPSFWMSLRGKFFPLYFKSTKILFITRQKKRNSFIKIGCFEDSV